MTYSSGKKITSAILIISALAIGCAVGFRLEYPKPSVGGYEKILFSGMKDAVDSSFELCSSQMMQFFAVFISGFTFFSYPVCFFINGWRAMLLSRALSYGLSNLPISSLIPMISYAVITLFISFLSYKSMTFEKNRHGGKASLGSALSHSVLFLTVSGASIFVKILPIYFFSK